MFRAWVDQIVPPLMHYQGLVFMHSQGVAHRSCLSLYYGAEG